MSDHDNLLRAVLAVPDDIVLRLAFADWFEENGDAERGEFIRVQCRLAALTRVTNEWHQLYDRARELLSANRERWVAAFPALRDRAVKVEERWEFHRGFVEGVTLSARSFLDHGEAIFQLAPVRRVRITAVQRHLPSVLRSPLLPRVRDLQLTDVRFTWANIRQLAQTQALSQVQGLYLGSSGIGGEAAEELFSSPFLGNLRDLNLAFSPVGGSGLHAIAEADLPSLRSLCLIGASVEATGLEALVSSPLLPNLSEMSVGSASVGPREAEAIASAPVPRLKHLDFELGQVGSRGALAIANSRGMANLEVLRLLDNAVGPEGAEAVAASPHLRRLRELDLGTSRIGDRGAVALARSPVVRTLEALSLGWARIKTDGVVALANSPGLANLTYLDLCENNFGSEGAKALAESPHLAKLECLCLTHTKLLKRDREMLRERFGEALML